MFSVSGKINRKKIRVRSRYASVVRHFFLHEEHNTVHIFLFDRREKLQQSSENLNSGFLHVPDTAITSLNVVTVHPCL